MPETWIVLMYMYLYVYPLSFSLSRGDVLFILITVSSLLPSITDPSHSSPPNPSLTPYSHPLLHPSVSCFTCSQFPRQRRQCYFSLARESTTESLWDQSLPWQQHNTRNDSVHCLPPLSLMEHCYQGI